MNQICLKDESSGSEDEPTNEKVDGHGLDDEREQTNSDSSSYMYECPEHLYNSDHGQDYEDPGSNSGEKPQSPARNDEHEDSWRHCILESYL